MKYANIIVNISHENLDKTFQYRVPDDLKASISIGDYVSIPFGKSDKVINGYVLELTDRDILACETSSDLYALVQSRVKHFKRNAVNEICYVLTMSSGGEDNAV